MTYLPNTNALSALRRKKPAPEVAPRQRFISASSPLGEIRRRVEAMTDSARRLALSDWLETARPAFFAGRLFGIDAAVAARWGSLLARAGRPLPAIDSLLAATALRQGLVLVTRDVTGFFDTGVELINPWGDA